MEISLRPYHEHILFIHLFDATHELSDHKAMKEGFFDKFGRRKVVKKISQTVQTSTGMIKTGLWNKGTTQTC